jgi:hypothetical protein
MDISFEPSSPKQAPVPAKPLVQKTINFNIDTSSSKASKPVGSILQKPKIMVKKPVSSNKSPKKVVVENGGKKTLVHAGLKFIPKKQNVMSTLKGPTPVKSLAKASAVLSIEIKQADQKTSAALKQPSSQIPTRVGNVSMFVFLF